MNYVLIQIPLLYNRITMIHGLKMKRKPLYSLQFWWGPEIQKKNKLQAFCKIKIQFNLIDINWQPDHKKGYEKKTILNYRIIVRKNMFDIHKISYV